MGQHRVCGGRLWLELFSGSYRSPYTRRIHEEKIKHTSCHLNDTNARLDFTEPAVGEHPPHCCRLIRWSRVLGQSANNIQNIWTVEQSERGCVMKKGGHVTTGDGRVQPRGVQRCARSWAPSTGLACFPSRRMYKVDCVWCTDVLMSDLTHHLNGEINTIISRFLER